MEKESTSTEKDKPVLDEQTLAKLLEAAYVLQEHNRELQEMELGLELRRDRIEAEERSAVPVPPATAAKAREAEVSPPPDYTFTLAQIVGTQHQIQIRHLELQKAISLIAERIPEIARAGGAAIGILDGKKVGYRAAAGLMTLPPGTEVPMEKALCVACLRTGQVVRCADVGPEFLLDPDECRRRGIQSMIAVPIFHEGEVAGGLELYYAKTQAFSEQDVHTCQLMAGLVTEALAREEELSSKKSLASERAVMLDALEKLKPNLAALVDTSSNEAAAKSVASAKSPPAAAASICSKCGHRLLAQEQFCGKCGSPRSIDYQPPSMQAKIASLWHIQEEMKKSSPPDAAKPDLAHAKSRADSDHEDYEVPLADSIEEQAPELFTAVGVPSETIEPAELSEEIPGAVLEAAPELDSDDVVEAHDDGPPETKALAKPQLRPNWSSAASARDFLEQLALTKQAGGVARFWNTRRGDIYLAIAVILVVCVIRWGIWSNHSVGATGTPAAATAGHHKPAPDADLSLFDRMLISLGLAEPPDTPESKGNPNTQVWVDLHTALYYCPGADLYGKTPKGKFTSQRDAQLDQYEPAYRKACE